MGVVAATLALGCPSTNTIPVEHDAAFGIDVGLDAGLDFGIDASPYAPWPTAKNTEYCPYYTYGSPCRVPCEAPPEARFTVVVHWNDAYCCTALSGGPYETFSGCRCVDGFAECPRGFEYWSVPQSTCEFCGRDAQGSPDAG